MPGWAGSDRRRTLPEDWPVRQANVLRRDHRRCQHIREDTGRKCGRRATDVDHIISHRDGGTDDYPNLQALCSYHHRQKSGREGGLASGRARRARADATKPLHPGLIEPSSTTTPASPTRHNDESAPF